MLRNPLLPRRLPQGTSPPPCTLPLQLLLLPLLLLLHTTPHCSAFNSSDLQQLTQLLASRASAATPQEAASLNRHARLRWASGSFNLASCPHWLKDYAEQHKAALSPPAWALGAAPPRLMLHRCWDHNTKGCPGIGDRMRGLMETLAWAVHTRRAFLLKWEDAAPLEQLLLPAEIDWRLQPRYNLGAIAPQHTAQYWWGNREPVPPDILSDAISTNLSLSRLKLMTLTHPLQGCVPKLREGGPAGVFRFQRKPQLPGPDIGCYTDMPPDLRSCVFHALFKPSPKLSAFVAQVRSQLMGSATAPYVAVHLRLGGFKGEQSEVQRFGNLSLPSVVARTLSAGRALADIRRLPTPVLVLTDNDLLRQALQEGRLPGFVSPNYRAAHVQGVSQLPGSSDSGSGLESAQLTSFADMALLASATCFIGSKSGFTSTSLAWGRHSCFLLSSGDREALSGGWSGAPKKKRLQQPSPRASASSAPARARAGLAARLDQAHMLTWQAEGT